MSKLPYWALKKSTFLTHFLFGAPAHASCYSLKTARFIFSLCPHVRRIPIGACNPHVRRIPIGACNPMLPVSPLQVVAKGKLAAVFTEHLAWWSRWYETESDGSFVSVPDTRLEGYGDFFPFLFDSALILINIYKNRPPFPTKIIIIIKKTRSWKEFYEVPRTYQPRASVILILTDYLLAGR